jgi:hypothetical protein
MWVSVAPSLIAISPPRAVSDEQQAVAHSEQADGGNGFSQDVSDFHFGFSYQNGGSSPG